MGTAPSTSFPLCEALREPRERLEGCISRSSFAFGLYMRARLVQSMRGGERCKVAHAGVSTPLRTRELSATQQHANPASAQDRAPSATCFALEVDPHAELRRPLGPPRALVTVEPSVTPKVSLTHSHTRDPTTSTPTHTPLARSHHRHRRHRHQSPPSYMPPLPTLCHRRRCRGHRCCTSFTRPAAVPRAAPRHGIPTTPPPSRAPRHDSTDHRSTDRAWKR